MSKKHYTAMAKMLAGIRDGIDPRDNPEEVFDAIVRELADLCAQDNERFDYARFNKAVYHAK